MKKKMTPGRLKEREERKANACFMVAFREFLGKDPTQWLAQAAREVNKRYPKGRKNVRQEEEA